MSVLPTCPERVLYQQESSLNSPISPAPCEALYFSAGSSCGFTSVAQTDVEQAGGGGFFPLLSLEVEEESPQAQQGLGSHLLKSNQGH